MLRFRGEICGVGTEEGTRIVIGRWSTSPFGSFADAMVERRDGRRLLIAPTPAVAEFIAAVYEFDDVVLGQVATERSEDELRFAGGPLEATVDIGSRDPLGWALRALPAPLVASRAWATVIDPVARLVLDGVRTRGMTAGGREYYGARDRHRVDGLRASWDGSDLGRLRDVTPAVRFGFSSTPTKPSLVSVVTTVVRASTPAQVGWRGRWSAEQRGPL